MIINYMVQAEVVYVCDVTWDHNNTQTVNKHMEHMCIT